MLFIQIDNTTSKNVVGFEFGTRSEFDSRHGGNTSWIFVDYNNAVNRSDFDGFILNPTLYFVDKNGNLRLRS